MNLILASSSPRRAELMRNLGYAFTAVPADIDETLPKNLGPEETVRFLAFTKAQKILDENPDAVVVGSDTLVFQNGHPLGKPADENDAVRMLKKLSGKTHEVLSGAAVLSREKREVFHVKTLVTFYPLSEELIKRYAATGEPLDKAGAYGIQGYGSVLVKEIRGDYFNVMGLPVAELFRKLAGFGIFPDKF